jgi:PEP-CTERM motif-containing protein
MVELHELRRSFRRFLDPVVVVICLSPTTSWAGSFTPDQSDLNLFFVASVQNVRLFGPIGQEFVPTLPFLDVVQLSTEDFGVNPNGIGASLFVNIRSGTITGPIVGTSLLTALPDGFGLSGGAITEFDFPSKVPLVPGNTFVIELVISSGDDWGVGSCGGLCGNTYPAGRAILFGVPQTDDDLWFAEGNAVPEPATLALLGTGVSFLLARKRFAQTVKIRSKFL